MSEMIFEYSGRMCMDENEKLFWCIKDKCTKGHRTRQIRTVIYSILGSCAEGNSVGGAGGSQIQVEIVASCAIGLPQITDATVCIFVILKPIPQADFLNLFPQNEVTNFEFGSSEFLYQPVKFCCHQLHLWFLFSDGGLS